jgi:hypothetical protein
MSFYNVANPVNFTNFDGNAKRIAPLSALTTVPSSQYFTAPPAISGLPAGQMSVSQFLAGAVITDFNFEGTGTIYLPRPQDILAGLRNSSINDQRPIAQGDCLFLYLYVVNDDTEFSSTSRTGVQGDTSRTYQAANSFKVVAIQFDNVTAGQEHYNIL